jgi:hypothetical protein
MKPTKCAAFFAEGLTHIFYAADDSLVESAEQVVPDGVPFIVLDVADLPPRSTRAEWTFDYSTPSGYGKNIA